jgi:hypothetical protein
MGQVVQVLGSVLVLVAFVLNQRGRMKTSSRPYLVLNFVGSGILAVIAIVDLQYGFLLLEGSWAIVSGMGLARSLRSDDVRTVE